jgi:hypothetical protein
MGCLQVTISRVGGLEVSLSCSAGMETRYSRVDGLETSLARVGGLTASLTDAGEHLRSRLGIVCRPEPTGWYLEVNPEEVQWITDDMGVVYNVQSNVEWTIE